jgi:transcriptional regulator with XRE-family HTH domain
VWKVLWIVDVVIAFGIVLKRQRLLKGLTQERLAAESGYHTTYISQIERGRKKPSILTIFCISKVLGIQPHKLILLTEEELTK